MKVLIVEDHLIVVSGCRALFADDSHIELHHAGSLKGARDKASETKPDVFVLDVNLPDGSGLEYAKELLADDPNAKIVVFTMSDAPILAVQVLELGALGYVSKNGDPMNLKQAIMAVSEGRRWVPTELVQEIALMRTKQSGRHPVLSERQMQILRHLARGKNMSEIAHEIDVCYKTVASNCAEMRSKLNARTSSEMVRIASQLRLV